MIWRVWTFRRGKIDPPERIDEFNEYMVETLSDREKQEQVIAKQIEAAHRWEIRMKES